MYVLIDTFNDVALTTHRTLTAAARAQAKHQRAVKRCNGPDSYLTYRVDHVDGQRLSADEFNEYQDALLDAQNK